MGAEEKGFTAREAVTLFCTGSAGRQRQPSPRPHFGQTFGGFFRKILILCTSSRQALKGLATLFLISGRLMDGVPRCVPPHTANPETSELL